MNQIDDVLSSVSHRPWALPEGPWKFYQEWNRAIFLHFEVPLEVLRPLVPEDLELDSLDGKYYVSIVPFTMENIRPRRLPAVGVVSDFDEINVRTYVVIDGKPGVYFINIEVGKSLSAFVSRTISGLPYEKSDIIREKNAYLSLNEKKRFFLKLEYQKGEKVKDKTTLDLWLTERYCLYVYVHEELFRYQIHHKEWPIRTIKFDTMEFDYSIGDLHLTEADVIAQHYSKGVVVVSWDKEKIKL
ncbi:DUF2071 domain-containing protein [Myroides odoratimimus]|uniref:YqjF family protein n=1 Tax=Myroides odoratimimus TaxID=76832 RepID=UPI002DB7A40B|nr:DUF2071 domain-containing protein [Myroides odoratimimus]MEC4052539.1 DUF2071 domain-containing protein [Myroides odoratimimus]